jgi:hypothetical protein
VGKYTQEEFGIAKRRFDRDKSPRILIYQKDIALPKNQSRQDTDSRHDFLDALREAEHFPTPFENVEGLLKHLKEALENVLESVWR